MSKIDWLGDYEAIRQRAGFVELQDWSFIELRGRDRGRLLNSLATNRLDDLSDGRGRETFLTEIKGHVLGHGLVLAGAETASFVTASPQGEAISAHFDRYIIREDVQVRDRSAVTAFVYLGGPQAEDVLQTAGFPVPETYCDHATCALGGFSVRTCRVEMTGPVGFLLAGPSDRVAEVNEALQRSGAKACAGEAYEAARIEWGWPLDGIDVSADNFPQEIGRTDYAVSLSKGCYLGQETVARIDSRGHVNKCLVVVRFPEAEAVGSATLSAGGKTIGTTTSTAHSPQHGCPIALSYVRREWSEPGTKLDSTQGPAEIVVAGRLADGAR